ncbi:MAG: nucleotidyltransferase domain-containing protein [Luteitalea sp.]|nr:nucleotidyltransferase domain-containing protein [Luteitalea sp.]
MGTLVAPLGTTTKAGSNVDAATLLFGSTRRRVLGWLLGHADESYYLREIVRHTGTSVGAVQRELEKLTAAGLLTRTVDGRQVYFQANRDAPIFPELRELFAKTAGLTDVLREALLPLADRVQVALVFGSAARGELRAKSDIDLLVIGDAAFHDVVEALGQAQGRLGRDINPTV